MGVGIISALGNLPRYVVTVHSPVVLEQEIIWRNQGVAGLLKLVFGRRLLEKMENRLLTAAAAIHTLSDFSRNTIDGFYGVGKKVSVIPHWYEHRENRKTKQFAREQLGWPADARIFLTVRGLKPRNGIDIAIRALAPLVQDSGNNCRFFIGGSGPLREHLENLSIELGAAKNIRFLGRLSDAELELAYSAADMFILPTLALECFGLITIEALSFGCPVISSDAAAIPETMRPILPNCIVPAGDVHAIQKKAAEYLSGEMSLPGEDVLTSHVFNRYTKDIVVSRYLQLFENP
jgi:glycosyltransferase involved in cell wall biosynthesis